VIAKVRERLAVGKQAAQRFDRQGFNLRKPNELEVVGIWTGLSWSRIGTGGGRL